MSNVTQLLEQIQQGDHRAAEHLLPIVYEELRQIAHSRMKAERPDHTLQTTALVHEVYLRLINRDQLQRWDSSGHFFSAAAEAMRRILVEHARSRLRKRRGGDWKRVELNDDPAEQADDPSTILAVNEAIDRLAEINESMAELVKLHCFAGFSIVEAAAMLGISKSSAYNDWNYAKAMMGRLLG